MFKFNFNPKQKDCKSNEPDIINFGEEEMCKPTKSPLVWRKLSKHKISQEHLNFVNILQPEQVEKAKWKENLNLKYIRLEGLDQSIEGVDHTTPSQSDLIPAIYEGGFKIWECTWELLNFIQRNEVEFVGKRILELGCGAGLLGIAAVTGGAELVVFQDYNEEVLSRLTIPNVILNVTNMNKKVESNTPKEELLTILNDKVHFLSGDWGSLCHRMKEENFPATSFDLILSSETIYNPDNYTKLIRVFEDCLAPGGEVLLASKSHYFGVGGGTHEFCNLVRSRGNFDVVTEACQGQGVQKEILRIKRNT